MAAHPGEGQGTHHQRSAVRLQQRLSHWLLLYAMSAIAAGLAAGYPLRDWTGSHTGGLGTLTTAAVFLVIYPMMVNLRVEALARAGRNVRGLGQRRLVHPARRGDHHPDGHHAAGASHKSR